ncbi:Ni/Co efflux regulator RcnB [Brevundimonas nasdae]|uniref:RcnB family protein n=1 Tax=Brevundimonas nasdae TaxID=172043 RepID=UPI0019130D4C|nr:RcnB family protein [Brevundimonas nasdae]MBK6026381.1 RcnB family protein [Brevundimonas nasdae]MDQ0453139.1 Ni/Co efflux regulator RcnB [Brevundimonas nasdae]
MTKLLTAAVAAVLATTSLGAAGAASAQSRNDHRYEQRQDHRNYRPNPHQNQRPAPRHDQRDYRQDQRDYARWQQAQRRYNAPRYVAPRGYATRSWSYGQRMPSYYRTSNYVVNDYSRYGLRAPPRGYQYVRSGNDVVLAVVATGLVTAVIAGLFN